MNIKIQFTEIEAVVPNYLTKVYTLHNDKLVTKETSAYLSRGIGRVLEMSVPEMIDYLRGLPANRVLTYGTPQYEEMIVLSAREWKEWISEPGDNIICRNDKDIRWNKGPGWLMVDHDVESGRRPLNREEFLESLYTVWPALVRKPHIWLPSASSCIYYPDGSEYRGVAGQRLLVPLMNGGDVPRILRILNMRLWLHHYGFIRISKAGSQLVRSTIDICTGQPSRLDFIGGALCLGGLYQKRKELITGYNIDASFVSCEEYPRVTRSERQQYEDRLHREMRKTAREARRTRSIWVRKKIEERLQQYSEQEREIKRIELQRIYGHAAEHGELSGDFQLWCNTLHCHVTINEVLADQEKFNNCEFAHPLEPDNPDKRVAIALLTRKPPILFSHLHGREIFVLKKEITKYTTLHEGEARINEILARDCHSKLILVTPGVGKTLLAIKDATRRTEGGIVIYAMANHRLINSTLNRLEALPNEVKVIHYYGRWWEEKPGNTLKEGKDKNCSPEMMKEIKKVTELGYAPTNIVCRHCRLSPWRARTRGGKTCRYWQQFKGLEDGDSALIFCTTLGLGSLLDNITQPVRHIFIDEQAADAMLNRLTPLTSDAIKTIQGHVNEQAFAGVKKLIEGADTAVGMVQDEGLQEGKFYVHANDDSELSLIDYTDLTTQDLRNLKKELERLIVANKDEKEDFYRNGLNFNAVRWLNVLCRETKGKQNAWIKVDTADSTGRAKYCFSEIRDIPKTAALTILDATGDKDENERIFGRSFETLDVKVGWKGTGIWLQKRRSKTVLVTMTDVQIQREIEEEVLPYIPTSTRKGFLATAYDLEKRVLKILKKLTPEIEWKSTHYWGARGLNDFEDCDFGLLYGFSYKNVSALEDDARTIFGSDEITRKRWCDSQNGNELYQTIERLRLCRNPGRTLLVFGPLYPIELLGRPCTHVDLRQEGEHTNAELAAERILAFMSINHIRACSKRYCWLLNICQNSETDKMLRIQYQVRANNKFNANNPQTRDLQVTQPLERDIIIYMSLKRLEPTDNVGLDGLPIKIILDFLTQAENMDPIISADTAFWHDVWAEVSARDQNLGKLEVKHEEINKKNFSHGVGCVEDGEKLDMMFQDFGLEQGTWRVRE